MWRPCLTNISASIEGRETTREVVSRTAESVFIPLTVGGGVRTVDDIRSLLLAGADKVSVNSSALERPELIGELAAGLVGDAVTAIACASRASAGPAAAGRADEESGCGTPRVYHRVRTAAGRAEAERDQIARGG